MAKRYRSKVNYLEAVLWNKVGDHPDVVPFLREDISDTLKCRECDALMMAHGHHRKIRTTVCPGDYVIDYEDGAKAVMSKSAFDSLYENKVNMKLGPKIRVGESDTIEMVHIGDMPDLSFFEYHGAVYIKIDTLSARCLSTSDGTLPIITFRETDMVIAREGEIVVCPRHTESTVKQRQ